MKTVINAYGELLPDSVIERASKLSPALLCDGMAGLGIKRGGCMDAEIKPANINMRLIGTAMTVDTPDGDNFPIHLATYGSDPGYVMVIAGHAHRDCAYIGELISSAAKAKGLCGIVVDGYVRDRLECMELGIPIFCRGFIPRGPIKKGPGAINVPVKCAGADVNPGDLIFGDADGVAVVPREHIETVLCRAEEKARYEEKRVKVIHDFNETSLNGGEPPELTPQWFLDM